MPKTKTKIKTKSKTQEKLSNNKQNLAQQKQQRKSHKQQYQRGVAKGLNTYSKHFQEFEQELKPLGLMIRDVDGDGNCMFRSISHFIDGTEKNHMKYRQKAVDLLEEHKDFYSLFIEDDITFEKYLMEMRQDGEWGGHHELQALTNVLSVNFLIHMKSRPAMIITSMRDGLSRIDSLSKKKTIHLAYHLVDNVAEHYSSIRLISDNTQDPAEDIPLKNLGMDLSNLKDYTNDDDQITESYEHSDNEDNAEIDDEPTKEIQQKQSRNKKCSCGSKKAYKSCCAQKKQVQQELDNEIKKSQIIFI